MSKVTVFVGLDYHRSAVQVCVMDAKGRVLCNRSCPNDWQAVAALAASPGQRVEAAVEACCGAADLAEELIARAGWSVSLAHPGYVARIKQSPDKTDWSDARLLADLVRVGYLPKVWLAPEPVRDLRRLVRYRQQLAAERRAAKLRVGALLRECRVELPGSRWTKRWRAALRECAVLGEQGRWVVERHLDRVERLGEELRQVEERLEQLTAEDPQVRRLLSLPGVGLVTAVVIRAEIGRFDRFRSGKQLARFCGLSPRNASSGQRQADAGLIKAGNPQLRTVLVEAACRLRRHDPRWRGLASRLLRRGKPGSVVNAALANRFARWLYHQMADAAA